MMKPITRIIVFNLLLFAVSSSRATPSSGALNGPLYVYGYDSFFSKGSLGVLLNQEFEKRYGMKVKAVAFASEGEALNQIVLQGKKSNADVLVGLDNSLLARAEQSKLFRKMESGTWKNRLVDGLPNDLTFIPFDYGYLAFVYDSSRKGSASVFAGIDSLSGLAENERIKKTIVIEDPRMSSIGSSFLLGTRSELKGDDWKKFWSHLGAKVLTISPGWSGAYGLFLKGEADLVLSYTTSPAYHEEMEKKTNYAFIHFKEGHVRQVESVAIVASSAKGKMAEKYIELLLSPEIQEQLPKKQWMYPAVKGIRLPTSFTREAEPKTLAVNFGALDRERPQLLREWAAAVAAE